MVIQIDVSELSKETRETLGIELEPTLGKSGIRHIALGKVLKALDRLEDEDALWVLFEARHRVSRQGQVVNDVLTTDNSYKPPVSFTVQVVARKFGLSVADLKRRSRSAEIVQARQVAMYVLVMVNAYSLKVIGEGLGGRSPATVSHGFQKIASLVDRDRQVQEILKAINEEIW